MKIQKTKKMLPLKVERKDDIRQWLADNSLPAELLWDGQKHVSCSRHSGGTWQFVSYGDYQGSDWQHRLYIAHRCSGCGMMVQHNQVCPEAGKERLPLTRSVVIP